MQDKDKESARNFNIGPRYQFRKYIGQGAYGVVIQAYDTKYERKKVAIKKLHKITDIIDAKRILREIRILRYMKHENVLQLHNIIYDDSNVSQEFGEIFLVTNYMEIDLFKVIRSKQELTDDHIQYIMYQIVRGLYYLHSANVIHRDLKPGNILANQNCDIRMCDYGLARNVDDEVQDDSGLTEYVVTRYYRAPEVMLSSHEYGKPVDMWSVGCTFAELISKKILFPGDNYINQIKLIIQTLGKPKEEDLTFITNQNAVKFINQLPEKPRTSTASFIKYDNQQAIDLLDKMLEINPSRRVTAQEALKHPYFEGLHDPLDEPSFEGNIDFKFENDPTIKLNDVRIMILEEINYFKKINNEKLLDIPKVIERANAIHSALEKQKNKTKQVKKE